MAVKSSARQWFEEVCEKADPFAYLSGLPTSDPPTFEEEWREFKGNLRNATAKSPPKPSDILRIWSESVSGFANTGGGVLVWGINARKKDGIDAANDLSLIEDLSAFRSTLQQNVHATTSPPVQGIEIREFTGESDKGFIVCFVPESTNKPHRSEQAGSHKPYFIRVGDSFVVPNPVLLRQMFFPRFTPTIRVTAVASEGTHYSKPGERCIIVKVAVLNDGQATARELVVLADTKMKGEYEVGYHWQKAPGLGLEGFECQRALHPGMRLACFTFITPEPAALTDKIKPIRFSVFARDFEKQLMSATITDDDLLRQRTVEAQLEGAAP